MIIIPTTGLQKDFGEAEERIRLVKDQTRWIQVDVCDNTFAPGKTFELELLRKLEFNSDDILWDIHLMVKEPEKWIEKCLFIGASRITGQVEMMSDRESFVKKIKDEGFEAGLAFDIGTEVHDIPDETDLILIMGRKAGFGEYPLDEKVLEKITMAKKFDKLIAVDGGATENNLKDLKKAGADIIYSGAEFEEITNGKNNQKY